MPTGSGGIWARMARAALLAHDLEFVASLPHALQSRRDAAQIGAVRDKPVHAILDDFGMTADIGRQHGTPAQHRFDHRQGKAFISRRHDQTVILGPYPFDGIDESLDLHAVPEAQPINEFLDHFAHRPVAIEREEPCSIAPLRLRQGFQ